jgi:WD40 repeat protein
MLVKVGAWDLSWGPEGKRLAGACSDGEVKVWDVATGEVVLRLRGHTGRVARACFSPDGRRITSAGLDGTVKVWDAATGQEALTLRGHTGEVYNLAWSPDGRRIASASGAEVKVWEAGPAP